MVALGSNKNVCTYTLPTVVLVLSIGIHFYRRLSSENSTLEEPATPLVNIAEEEHILSAKNANCLKDVKKPQMFAGLAKNYNWKAFDWSFENGFNDPYENSIEVEFRRSKSSSFMYTDNIFQTRDEERNEAKNEKDKVAGDVINREEQYFTATFKVFFQKIIKNLKRKTKNRYFYYLTYPLEGKLSTLLKYLRPSIFDAFCDGTEDSFKSSNSESTFPFTSIWIGSKGVVTRLHYDIPNNMFIQIKGKKTFYIYPPSLSLKFYPYLHPAARKSRFVDILTNETNDESDLLQQIKKHQQVFELNEGDVLYIPSMFAHHVVSDENSISLNIFGKSNILKLMNEIEEHPIPFESYWNKQQFQVGTGIWVHTILAHFYDKNEFLIESFVTRFRKSAYIDYNIINIKMLNAKFECFDRNDKNGKYEYVNYRKFQKRLSTFIQIFQKYGFNINANNNADKFESLASMGKLELILGRYLENVIYNFVLNDNERSGGHHNTYISTFLKRCFTPSENV